ncbi:MAG: RNA polymerase sigma factor [Terriglobia bacterium]
MAENVRSIAIPLDRNFPVNAQEAALIAELKSGSEPAFAYLMSVYRNPIYNVVYHVMGDEADASDVLQNVFVKIIRGIKQFHNESSLKTWIYRIAVHEALNYRRSWFRWRRREAFSLDDESRREFTVAVKDARREEGPYEVLEQRERQEMVTAAVQSLAEPYRAVVVLREVEDLSYEEIGEVLGLAEGTVKSRLKRGRDLLRRKLASCLAVRDY